MSFEQDFIHGYEKHTKYFDKWCKNASSILGNVTQCGVSEFDSAGYAFVALNRPDFGECYIDKKGYLIDEYFTYSVNFSEGFRTFNSNSGARFLRNNEEALFDKKFDLWHGFTYLEKIDNNIHRRYFFSSDTENIYNVLLNNLGSVKRLINDFKRDTKHIINYFRDRKFNIAEKKKDYFTCAPKDKYHSEREKLVNILRALNLLDKDTVITDVEWKYLHLCTLGKSVSQIGDILKVSSNTVMIYLEVLKAKLKVSLESSHLTHIVHYEYKPIYSIH